MTLDERLDSIARSLDTLTRIHLDDDREYPERMKQLSGRIDQLTAAAERDGENIRALARIAEIHERRLTDLEGGEQ